MNQDESYYPFWGKGGAHFNSEIRKKILNDYKNYALVNEVMLSYESR